MPAHRASASLLPGASLQPRSFPLTPSGNAREPERRSVGMCAARSEDTGNVKTTDVVSLPAARPASRVSQPRKRWSVTTKTVRTDSHLSLRDVSRAMISYHFSLSFLSGRSLPLFFSLTINALAHNKPVAMPARWLAWSIFLNGVKTPKVSRTMINDNKT